MLPAEASRPVFSTAGRTVLWRDVVAAAGAWGTWPTEPVRRVSAAEAGAAVTAWRRRHRLLSTDETVAWLAHWGLGTEDLLRHAGHPDPPSGEAGVAAWAEAVCGGALFDAARRLADRLALAGEWPASFEAGAMRALDDAYERRCAELATPEELARLVAAHAQEWTRLELRVLRVADAEAASEAALCVRADGMALAEVAPLAGGELEYRGAFLDEIEPVLRPLLVSAQGGDVVGPQPDGGTQVLAEVLDRRAPELADGAVRERAQVEAVRRAVARAQAAFTWHEEVPVRLSPASRVR